MLGTLPLAMVLGTTGLLLDAGPKIYDGVYLSPGVILSGTSTIDGVGGFFGGGEVSVNALDGSWIYGGYVDAGYSFATSTTRIAVGPQFAYSVFGLDVAYLASIGDGGVRHGLQYSGWFSMGFFAVYVRHCVLFDALDEIEAGVMLKIPLPLWEDIPPRVAPGPPPPEAVEGDGSLILEGDGMEPEPPVEPSVEPPPPAPPAPVEATTGE